MIILNPRESIKESRASNSGQIAPQIQSYAHAGNQDRLRLKPSSAPMLEKMKNLSRKKQMQGIDQRTTHIQSLHFCHRAIATYLIIFYVDNIQSMFLGLIYKGKTKNC